MIMIIMYNASSFERTKHRNAFKRIQVMRFFVFDDLMFIVKYVVVWHAMAKSYFFNYYRLAVCLVRKCVCCSNVYIYCEPPMLTNYEFILSMRAVCAFSMRCTLGCPKHHQLSCLSF